jgi:hypothetical protein
VNFTALLSDEPLLNPGGTSDWEPLKQFTRKNPIPGMDDLGTENPTHFKGGYPTYLSTLLGGAALAVDGKVIANNIIPFEEETHTVICGVGYPSTAPTITLTYSPIGSGKTCTFRTIVGHSASTMPSKPTRDVLYPTNDPLRGYERYSVPNWDGYDAEPISAETISAARSFLKMLPTRLGSPDIAPGSDGTIGFEWIFEDQKTRKLFIDIGPGRVWSGYWRKNSGANKTLAAKKISGLTPVDIAVLLAELVA